MNDSFKLAPGEWIALRRLLDQALDLPEAERAAWLAALGPEDVQFRPRLQALLAHAEEGAARETAARLLDTLPEVETAQFAPTPHDSALAAGSTVGPYRLLLPLGEGGMGEVWLAERTDLLQQRQVALKLPRLVTGRARLAERLAREREILATLEHPNIARLYDAGIAADGQPYLALEYVEGERIDAWCARKALDVPARLRLFLQVARAVAHAHARLVVHRDLKPANILVTEAGEVHLLDFGIAKLLEDGRVQETELTRLAGRALTPDYAAPEQILGQPIGTAADVYALGVVLFELLTGTRPYRLKRDSRAALEEAIAQAEVQRPSSAVAGAKLRRRLRGDLDTVVLKALKRAPAERYGTVEALADDIERHLDQRPVKAQPDSFGYRLRKFVARNRLAVGAASVAALALLVGAGVAAWQARVARIEQARAELVKSFLLSMFDGINPEAAGPGRSVSATQVLDRAAARLPEDGRLRDELVAALVRARLGLHEYPTVLALTEPVAAAAVGPNTPVSQLELRWARAQALKQLQRLDESEQLLAPLLAPALPVTAPELSARVRVLEAEIATQRAQYPRARDLGLALLADMHEAGADFDDHRTSAHLLVGSSLSMLRELGEAVKHSGAAYALQQRLRPDERGHPKRLQAGQAYAAHLIELGRHNEAAPLLQSLLDDARSVYGENNWLVPEFASRLAIVEAERGQFKSSVMLLEESLRASEVIGQPDSMAKAGILRTAARAYMRERRHAAAVPLLDRSLGIIARTPNPYVTRVVSADRTYAAALAGQLPAPLALAELQRLNSEQDEAEPRYRTHLPVHYLGRLQGLMGQTDEAVATLRKAEPLARANTRRIETAEALIDLALALLDTATVNPAAMRGASALLDEAEAMLNSANAQSLPAMADLAIGRARIALGEGQVLKALTAARLAGDYWRDADQPGHDAGVAAYWLARSLAANGQADAARAARDRAARLLGESPFAAAARLRAPR